MKVPITAVVATAAVLAAITVPTEAKAPVSRIVVFGTSLSDSGNAFALVGGTNTPPDYVMNPLLIPAVPYTRGGHHFSNGATWVEQFAQSRGLSGTVRPAFAGSDSNHTNFAVGAARAWEDGQNFNLSLQVEEFLGRFGQSAPSDALYVIEMGGNDIRDALVAYGLGQDGGAILTAANTSIAQNIQRLYLAGARNFLVWRAPNVGATPAIRSLGPATAGFATTLTIGFNNGLDGVVASLLALPGISIARLDAYDLINDMVTDRAAFGFSDVTTACLMPGVEPFFCQTPNEFLFWDGIHPTRAAHAFVAERAATALGW